MAGSEAVRDGFVAMDSEPAAKLIDLRERFVLPGLIDCHVHLKSDKAGDEGLLESLAGSDAYFAYEAAANARKTLEAGFTTVRNLGDARGVTLALRAVRASEPIRARDIATVHLVSRDGNGPAEARRAWFAAYPVCLVGAQRQCGRVFRRPAGRTGERRHCLRMPDLYAWLSWFVFLAGVLVIGLGSVGYHLAHLYAMRHLDTAAKEQDRLFGFFRSLVEGAKELRLNAKWRARFSNSSLNESIEVVRRQRTLGMSVFVASAAWGNFLVYAFIGLVLFVFVGDVPDRARVMTGFALVFVYMVGPLEALLLRLPRANLARASASRVSEITESLMQTDQGSEPSSVALESVQLSDVSHRYYHEGTDEVCTLGPLDLAFLAGEITYLVGGTRVELVLLVLATLTHMRGGV